MNEDQGSGNRLNGQNQLIRGLATRPETHTANNIAHNNVIYVGATVNLGGIESSDVHELRDNVANQ